SLSRTQLLAIASHKSELQCECPEHLDNISLTLQAFEAFSLQCENDTPADAAIHRELLKTSMDSRAAFEQALIRLAQLEGLPVPPS
ncbi:MAG: MerR family transcriptional regulator, partial [Gammaproteobacteria bacterium]|nr:MerR family transcriptional regulator [Gammaproteobacteria bacterium]